MIELTETHDPAGPVTLPDDQRLPCGRPGPDSTVRGSDRGQQPRARAVGVQFITVRLQWTEGRLTGAEAPAPPVHCKGRWS